MSKAISLKQPWANLVCAGIKTIETRKWKTGYRGDLIICSSKNPRIEPFGKALCIVELYHVESMKKEHEDDACTKLYDRANSWFVKNVRRFEEPFEVVGKLGIYDLATPDGVKFIK